ncbi:MAG: glycosyltransferase family 2 protein, partial [Fusobacteriaceae bacterium]
MKSMYVYLPCYNEALNIGDLIIEWEKQRKNIFEKGYELFVLAIDDCSSDNTGEVVKDFADKNPKVTLISHTVNKGLVGGLNTAITHFNTHGKENDLMT